LSAQDIRAPLADLHGAVPPAPAWFTAALANAPELGRVEVEGAGIETLAWGERGLPGLIFLHGNGAHARWWSFIAPFFAADYRVAALSWSGMGCSDHRDAYRIETFVKEIFAVATATGASETGPPLVVGHSFGGFPMMAAAAHRGAELRGAVIVDTPFRGVGEEGERAPNTTLRPHKVYPTLNEALARFRLAPAQGCENLYIADHVARGSLIEVPGGWSWAFDPYLWSRFEVGDARALLNAPQCPIGLIWGEQSLLMQPARVAAMRAALPAAAPAIGIPAAEHHVMIDQPLALVSALRGLFAGWPPWSGAADGATCPCAGPSCSCARPSSSCVRRSRSLSPACCF